MQRKTFFRYFLLSMALCCLSAATTALFAQERSEHKSKYKEFCADSWSSGDKVSFRDLRELTVAPTSMLTVDGKRNGGIRVIGENRGDVLVRACVQTWGETEEEARRAAQNIRIETGSVIRAENMSDETKGSVSYEIRVPRMTNMKLTAHNGGIGISSVDGMIEFETKNGGVSLNDVAGSVKGRTTNGGVSVKLSGATWRGSGLDVETTNGGVNLSMPPNYAARIETGTVNGGFKSNIGGLNIEKDDNETRWSRKKRVSADLNGGGAPIRVITTNGGVNISASDSLL